MGTAEAGVLGGAILERTGQRSAAWTALAIALALMLAACDKASPAGPVDLVPAGADIVGFVDLGKALTDDDVGALYGLVAGDDDPQTLEELLAEAEAETGISLREFQSIVFFAGLNGGTDPHEGFLSILLEGDFDPDEIFEAIRSHSTDALETAEHRGVEILVHGLGTDKEFAVAVIDAAMLVAGSLDAVKQVIDVGAGERDAMGGALLAAYEDLGEPWAKVVATLPAGLFDELGDPDGLGDFGGLGDLGDLPLGIDFLGDIRTIAAAVDKAGSDISTTAVLGYDTAAAAADAASLIDAAITLIGAFGPDSLGGVLDGIVVEVDGSSVTIASSVSVQQLRDLIDAAGASG